MQPNPSAERPSIIEQLRAETRGLPYRPAKRKKATERQPPSPEDSHRLFTIEKGNRWMELARREPEAKMLFGELWHQGELCMLFADTNIGKSVLAVQLAEGIARGQSIGPLTCQAPPARVLYIDFELTQRQFGLRYSKGDEDHQFSDNFYRAQYNFIPDPPPNVDENELLIAAIEYKVQLAKATVLIIDNITCLRGGTENSAVALSLMKSLKALKTDHNLSILVLAHTPKRHNPTQPISADDLHGSKLLINFADSAFAIGKSTLETDLCYLKQIKQRNTRQRYGADNVCLCRIQKPGAFLHFQFEGHSAEHHHLLTRAAAERRQLANKIATLAATGLSQRDISQRLDMSLTTVNRLLKCADWERCADVQMCGCANGEEKCADGEECENLTMSKFEDEEGCADMQMCGCADEESAGSNSLPREGREGLANYAPLSQMHGCIDEEGIADHPMTNDLMTNDLMTNPNPTRELKTSTIDKLLSPALLDHIKRTTMRENSIRGKGNDNINQPNTPINTGANNGGP